jgi:hypothetical protein
MVARQRIVTRLPPNAKAEPCRGAPPLTCDWNKPLTGAPRHWLQRPGSAIGFSYCRVPIMSSYSSWRPIQNQTQSDPCCTARARYRRPTRADQNRPTFLKCNEWVVRISLQSGKAAVRQFLNVWGKLVVRLPESAVGAVLHRSVQRPSCNSPNASSANLSSRPARTSCSNCRSHASASNSKNQVRKAESSSLDSPSRLFRFP